MPYLSPLRQHLSFLSKNRRICNYLRIKRLFGLHGNWVTRWQPFLFQSSLLFCTNEITPNTQRYNFFMNEQKGGAFFIVQGNIWIWSIINLRYYEFPDSVIRPFPCSSAKVVHQPLKVERSGGKPFRTDSSSYGEYSARKPFPFQCLYSEMQTATEMNDWRKYRR